MVRTTTLPDEVRISVAEQIGQMLPQQEGLVDDRLVLGESLRVRMLSVAGLTGAGESLRDATIELDEWHHQVLQGGEDAVLAASSIEEGGRQTVVEVANPAFTAALSNAVARLDEQLADDDDLAELLIAPSWYLAAILISGREERVLVVERPERLSTMEVGYLYPSAQFVATLRRYPPSAGVPRSA